MQHLDSTLPAIAFVLMDIQVLDSRLDALWIDYLDLLDTYVKGQAQIQKSFAAGFFSLAQANTRSSIGRRYGSDWYDNRTKATARIDIESEEQHSDDWRAGQRLLTTRVHVVQQHQYVSIPKEDKTSRSEVSDPVQQPTPPGTPSNKDNGNSGNDQQQAPAEKLQKDPLFWFGMLPPFSLRSAQTHFKSIVCHDETQSDEKSQPVEVSSPLATTANAARGMRAIEFEIGKLRKTIRQAQRAVQTQKDGD